MSDFFPWLWAPDSSKILMKPHDGSTTSAYLIDPAGGSWSTVPWGSGSDVDWQRLAPELHCTSRVDGLLAPRAVRRLVVTVLSQGVSRLQV